MKNFKPFIILGINKNKKKEFKISMLNLFVGFLGIIALSLSIILAGKLWTLKQKQDIKNQQIAKEKQLQGTLKNLEGKVLKDKYVFNINWGSIGQRMVSDGVIGKAKLAQAVSGKDELPKELEKYFSGEEKQIELTQKNAQFWVDVLWGLGIANKSKILDEGPMVEGGDSSQFASTGGWTLGVSDPMNYYSKFSYVNLSEKQEETVRKIAGNIYRPCCDNPTSFPDCNHGMAALGLIELMVSQNKSESEIYKTVLAFNTYWFPTTYLDIAFHFDRNGEDYEKIPPKEILSKTYSSATGAQLMAKEAEGAKWPSLQRGGSCGA